MEDIIRPHQMVSKIKFSDFHRLFFSQEEKKEEEKDVEDGFVFLVNFCVCKSLKSTSV